MATIYIHNIKAFDAANNNIVTFGYSGSQCIKNKIVIYENDTNVIAYENTVTTFSLSHIVPANSLSNGRLYKCMVTAYYMENNTEKSVTSSLSNVFACLSTPVWGLNVSNDEIIKNSYFTFIPDYFQSQGEVINEYYIVVYNSSGSVFWSSDAIYDISTQTTVNDLPNNTVLYVRAYGTTVNGLTLDTRNAVTGLDIKVNIDYVAPTFYSTAYLENNKWQGYVKAKTNVASIEGHTKSGKDAVFLNGQYVDLTNETVVFGESFIMDDNFVIQKLGYNISINKPYLKLIGSEFEGVVTFRAGTFDVGKRVFAELKVNNYVLNSNMIEVPNLNDIIHLWVQKKNGLYMIKITNLGVV